ncbi:SAF domain-containing protein [Arcanobacterium hippocoleae]
MLQLRAPNLRAYRVASPLRAMIWRWKYVALILIAATALQMLIAVISSEGIGNVKVLVATRKIEIGDAFTPGNTTTRLFPQNAVPENSLPKIDAISGKTASAQIPPGLPITTGQILDDQYLADAPAGSVITSITLRDDISAQLLKPGNHIELYAPAKEQGEPAKLLARNAIVIGKPEGKVKGSIFGDVTNTTVLYVAIAKSDASLILGLQTNTPLQAVITKHN